MPSTSTRLAAATRHLLAPLCALAVATAPAFATWSIVLVDTSTGEVAIGQATCLASFNLQPASAVVFVGKGAGVRQALVDGGLNAQALYQGFQNETPLASILSQIAGQDAGLQSRQFGMVALYGGGDALTFTGANTNAYKGGVTGQTGTLRYAIQGNILTGAPVILMAEAAVLNTPGDMAAKLMASMKAAAAMGGDGRCSCSPTAPTSCGAPPPNFKKSAHVGYMLIARIGDTNGPCIPAGVGCASGSYYMGLTYIGGVLDQDPVRKLEIAYTAWRAGWVGHADAIRTTAGFDVVGLKADGVSTGHLDLQLVDLDGGAITQGGASVVVTHDAGSAGSSAIGVVQDLGNGSYRVPVTAGASPGIDRFRVVVNDGKGNVTLYPSPELAIGAACTAYGAGSPGTGGAVPVLGCDEPPLVGNSDFGLPLDMALPGAAAVLAGCASAAAVPFFQPGDILVDLNQLEFVAGPVSADANGKARFAAPIPPDPQLSGRTFWVQTYVLDGGATVGLSASQGLEIEVL